ncbi:PQQ-binding-like beta-propeller repeat protein [Streptacidiphilus sp. PB12-B1b]|uniref:outer membrane protein assembly factor BamB family protein n=1 Tax=Streptacidiphilus sp. PB12-B1b TaxID=2705012 RepID=UPI0015FAAEFA|nr:PQQ-binding-like beta-propeller repeat protein [Streptacidiphilus sp. PB12-B1b]QMU78493.1 PQQ-binding-like beta-propeller repeat protein [Streptacidiphilus sp. PB12-B1b]
MDSEPDYGQYWGPDGQSAQGHAQPQPGFEQPGHGQSGYEQPGYGQSDHGQPQGAPQPDYGHADYGNADYGHADYGQQHLDHGQAGYGRQQGGHGGYPQQAGYPQDGDYQHQPGYPQSYDYSGYQGYPEQQQYDASAGHGHTAPAEADGQPGQHDPHAPNDPHGSSGHPGHPGTSAQEQASESTAAWSATEMYQAAFAAGAPTGAPGASGAEAAADGPSPSGAPGGSGRRSDRRSGRDQGAAGAGAAPAADGPLLSRLLAAATGRAPGTDRKTFAVRAVLGAAALVVLGAAGFAVAGGGSGSSSAKPSGAAAPSVDLASAHTKAWSAPADAGSANGNDGLIGSWLLASAVVRGDGMGVTAYSAASGSKLWTVAPPTAGAVPCAMSSTVGSTGVGAVLFQAKPGSGQACSLLVAVNTATGQAKWTATAATATAGPPASVMVNDTQVDVVGASGAVGYAAATGKQDWTYAGPGKYCVLGGNGTAGTLLLQSVCADTTPKQQVVALDAGTGKLSWWRGLPATAASYTVLSATPAVVSVHMADPTKDTLMSFSAQGDSQATIPVAQVGGRLDAVHGSFDADPALFFQGSTMLAELSPTAAGSGASAAPAGSGVVTAFDLATGKQVWQTAPAEKGQSALVGVDASGAVVATEERLGQPARLSHFDLATGKESPGGAFPQATGSLLTAGRVLYQGNLVVVVPQFTSTYATSATAYSIGSGG